MKYRVVVFDVLTELERTEIVKAADAKAAGLWAREIAANHIFHDGDHTVWQSVMDDLSVVSVEPYDAQAQHFGVLVG